MDIHKYDQDVSFYSTVLSTVIVDSFKREYMYIIFGNYGNETIALVQWAAEQALKNVYVVSVDTGWAAKDWEARVSQGEALAKQYYFMPVHLTAKLDFPHLIEQQQNFPSTKYQWCAGFLKGLVFLDWLDSVDFASDALILLGKYRDKSRALARLSEFIEESEYYGERRVWHPLYNLTRVQVKELVQRSGFSWLNHRSLECDPCVNNTYADFMRLQQVDVIKTYELEKIVKKHIFAPESYGDSVGIEKVIQWVKKQDKSVKVASTEISDMGCGSPFACGL